MSGVGSTAEAPLELHSQFSVSAISPSHGRRFMKKLLVCAVLALFVGTATAGLMPDATILLDLPVEEGFARKKASDYDRMERAGIEFHSRVRDGYLKIAQNNPGRFFIVDAMASPEHVREHVRNIVVKTLNKNEVI